MRKNKRSSSPRVPNRPGTRSTAIASMPSQAEQDALVALFNAGRLSEGETLARQFTERYPNAAFSWKALGTVLLAGDRNRDALPILERAVALAPRDNEAINSLGKTLQDLGRVEEALECFIRALTLRPDYSSALINRGNALARLGRHTEGLACLDQALSLNPNAPIAHNDRGNVLKALERFEDALAAYTQALALKPEFAEAHNNIGSVLRDLGRFEEALEHYQRALELKPDFLMARSNAAHCLKRLSGRHDQPAVRALLLRALRESWCHPGELMAVCVAFIKMNPLVQAGLRRLDQTASLSPEDLCGPAGLLGLADDALLMSLLETVPVADVDLERLLTRLRQAMLETVALNRPGMSFTAGQLRFFAALATQVYLNEYVFAVNEAERARIDVLKNALTVALQHQVPISAHHLLALATYVPLDTLPGAATLLERTWPEPVMDVLIRQIREPLEQAEYRHTMPCLTGIADGVSVQVRHQYEEYPYPRWVKAGIVPPAPTIDAYIRQQFPRARFQPLRKETDVSILVAGCGTGLHSLDTARRYPNARVLAIDLSLSSLAYAQRKTVEAGVTSIRYAQADILRLGELAASDTGEASFDLIESVGVLHHLQDPVAGWKALLERLRPGGFMSIGLYSETARRPVVMARELIAQQGYQAAISDIRRFRQELIARRDEPEYRHLTQGGDFFTLSGCRDLLFHVNEHRFTLPQLAGLLRELNLNFLGFILDQSIIDLYRQRFPDDPSATDLEHWHQVEQQNPRTFAGMYVFWVQKSGPAS
jgi:tetratricopeptide (TPR) repeat protein/SAM-dependent methyltransferase